MRKLATLAATAVATLVVGWTAPAGALAAPVPGQAATGSADFSVSTSAERLVPDAKGEIKTQLTIANNSGHDLDVSIRAAGVIPKDDGQVDFSDRPDPVWSRTAEFPSSLRLGANDYQRVPVSMRMPTGLLPDIYLLGFVVEAQPGDAAGIRLYHQIGALIKVEIPGPRERHMAVELAPTGFIHLGANFRSTFQVRNVGAAAALGRGQVRVDSAFTDENVGVYQANEQMELFPAGTGRSLDYQYEARGLFLLARPKAQVLYGSGGGLIQMAEGEGRTILIIPWLTIIILCVIVVTLTAYLYWRRRRREAARRALMAEREARHRGRRKEPACAG